MITHRCKNCLWWDNEHMSINYITKIEWKPSPGFCRRRKAGATWMETTLVAVHPVTDADEFCGEFKEDK